MTVNSKEQAWAEADRIFPTDYAVDQRSSTRAGYPIHRSTAAGHHHDYICDLGDRLEVNLSTGETVNIWIKAAEPEAPVETYAAPAETPAEKIAAALAGLPCLSERVMVYVPATAGVSAATDNAAAVDTVAARLSDWFGGATIAPGAGCWMSETAGLVKESTTRVFASCTAEQLAEHIAALRALCERIKREFQQEAVSLDVNGALYFI